MADEAPGPMADDRGALLVAHGSRDPRAAQVAHAVARAAEESVGVPVRAAFLELATPTPDDALATLVAPPLGVRDLAVVPFLLGNAYHGKTDLPKVVGAAQGCCRGVRLTDVLGPDPLLDKAIRRRLDEAVDLARVDAVVLAAAGSSDPDGNAGAVETATRLGVELRRPVVPAYASAVRPTVSEAVRSALAEQPGQPEQPEQPGRPRVAVAVVPYLLAPGHFATAIARDARAAGAFAVAEPLGPCAEVVALVVERISRAYA